MRKIILVIFIFLSVNSFAQFSTMFNDTINPFGYGGYDFNCIVQDDSFYYVLGGVNNNEPQWSNMILKLDKSFNIINKKKYLDTIWHTANYPYNSLLVEDNQIIVCPQITNKLYTAAFGKLVAINKYTLDTLWTKIISHPDTLLATQPNSGQFSDLTSIKQTPDGGYIFTGNYNENCIAGNIRSFLLKIDSIGNVEWRRTYSNISYLFDVELTPNGGYIVLNKYGGTNVTVLDSLGNILWQKKANNYIGVGTSGDLCYVGNNSFVVTTPYMYNANSSNPLMGINVFKINLSNQQVIFDKTFILYKNIECVGLHNDIGIEPLSDGSIIVNGTVEKYGTDKSAFILKLNANGDSLWTKTHRFKNSNISRSQLNDLMICDDGGFLGVGFFYNYTSSTAWMFKTDENGVIGWESPKPKGKSLNYKLYPNPSIDYTTLQYNCSYSNMSYMINDIQGRTLVRKPLATIKDISSNEVLIDLSSLSSGTYQIIIRTNETILWTKKLIITE